MLIKAVGGATLGSAHRAQRRFYVGFTFSNRQGEQLLTLPAEADFKVWDSGIVDFSREKELPRIESENGPIRKFDQCESIIEHFKRRFLRFALQKVSDHQHRLPFAFGTKVSQRML
ncbi:MAG TPA: hypothetical protein VEI50_15865 [Nitrospiraceae bacterium]|nr:hypothetical protein [Nitrospiraceae bacterium]